MENVDETKWTNLGLHQWIQTQLNDLKISSPNEIQISCIPEILKGKDCIGCAKTGSGKTAVFALPILQTLSEDPYGVCALILTPTRELASQIYDQFCAFGKSIRVKVSLIVGGESSTMQSIGLSKKPHVVVATPGRLASLLRENSQYFHFKRLKYLVLDEVDALLVPGDLERDISDIIDILPPATNRQTLAFSATSSGIIQTLSQSLKPELHFFVSKSLTMTAEKLNEMYFTVLPIARDAYLVYILQVMLDLSIEIDDDGKYVTSKGNLPKSGRQAIIFCPSCWQCHVIGQIVMKLGFSCSVLHSALSQNLRTLSLAKFRSRQTKILIATSLAGRGLDIPCVDLVVNYSLPYSSDEYVHHVGRTARAGRSGTSITFVAPYEMDQLSELESTIGKKSAEKFVKCCALMRKEISNNLYNDEESKLNRKIKRKRAAKMK